LYQMD